MRQGGEGKNAKAYAHHLNFSHKSQPRPFGVGSAWRELYRDELAVDFRFAVGRRIEGHAGRRGIGDAVQMDDGCVPIGRVGQVNMAFAGKWFLPLVLCQPHAGKGTVTKNADKRESDGTAGRGDLCSAAKMNW